MQLLTWHVVYVMWRLKDLGDDNQHLVLVFGSNLNYIHKFAGYVETFMNLEDCIYMYV